MRIQTWLVVLLLAITPCLSHAQVVISEIMYNPDSNEGWPPDPNDPDDKGEPDKVEWVELYNTGGQPVDISGWGLADEDGQTTAVRDGATIGPGEAVVLVPAQMSAAGFHAAWGGTFAVYPLAQWGDDGLYNLANAPSPDNEVLRLIDADGATVDEVNYDDEGDWPSDRPDGSSIYLPANMLDAELDDHGENWRRSEPGVDGAKNNKPTGAFNGIDAGSPGKVPIDP